MDENVKEVQESLFNHPYIKDFDFFVKSGEDASFPIVVKGKLRKSYLGEFRKTCFEVVSETGHSIYCEPANGNGLHGLQEGWDVEFLGTAKHHNKEYQMTVHEWNCESYFKFYEM